MKETLMAVLGSGSQLYKTLRVDSVCADEYRTKDLEKLFINQKNQHLVVFSLLDGKTINSLYQNYNGRITIVGSVAAIHPLFKRFSYSRLKNDQMKVVSKIADPRLKYLICGEFFPKDDRIGTRAVSTPKTFWDVILNDDTKICVVSNYDLIGDSNFYTPLVVSIEKLFSPVSSLIFKRYSNHLYGYNLYLGPK